MDLYYTIPMNEQFEKHNLSPERQAVMSARRLTEVTADFLNKLKGLGELDSLVKQGLSAKGLSVLESEYEKLLTKLDTLNEDVLRIEESPESDISKNIIRWAELSIPRMQMLIEALPRETGQAEDIIKQSDIASDLFHDEASKMFKNLGNMYYPLKLYRDNLQSPSAVRLMRQSSGAYKFDPSPQIVKAFPELRHGVMLRVYTLIHLRIPPNSESPLQGAFEYLYKPK